MKNKKKIFIAAILFLMFSFAPVIVSAAGISNKITISPSIINLKGNRGETINSSFTYSNGTDKEQSLGFSTSAFNSSGVKGSEPIFYTKDGKKVVSVSTDWIKIDNDSLKVAAGQTKEVFFSVNIPKDAEIGKYLNAIFVNSASSDQQVESSASGNLISYRVGILTFLDVTKEDKNIKMYYLWRLLILALIAILALVIWYDRKGIKEWIVHLKKRRILTRKKR